MEIAVVSLKYAPGLKKEFELIGRNLRSRGNDVGYIISANYRKLGELQDKAICLTEAENPHSIINESIGALIHNRVDKIFNLYKPRLLFFYNVHPLNPYLIRRAKENNPNTIVILYIHDPFKEDKRYYGLKRGLKISIAESIQKYSVRNADHIVFPSPFSLETFNRRYKPGKSQLHLARLLIPDDRCETEQKRSKHVIVGNVNKATGHDTFIQLVNYVAEHDLGFEFGLLSSGDIKPYIEKLSKKAQDILEIINKPVIIESEINEFIAKSRSVLRFDKEVTQSGVIPVAYMNGTPVIARDIPGLRQDVEDQINGVLIPANPTMPEIIEGMKYIEANIHELSERARDSYERIWAESNFEKYYDWLIRVLN